MQKIHSWRAPLTFDRASRCQAIINPCRFYLAVLRARTVLTLGSCLISGLKRTFSVMVQMYGVRYQYLAQCSSQKRTSHAWPRETFKRLWLGLACRAPGDDSNGLINTRQASDAHPSVLQTTHYTPLHLHNFCAPLRIFLRSRTGYMIHERSSCL